MNTKISTIVDEKIWKDFKKLSEESNRPLSGMMTEALDMYLKTKKIRPAFIKAAQESIEQNFKLGKLLAK